MHHGDSPSQPRQHVVQLVSVPKAGLVVVCFVGPYRGMLTHYSRGETLPCIGEQECPSAIHRIRPVWKGYAPVRVYYSAGDWWLPGVLEITECLEELLRGRYLVGELWELTRAAGKRRTRPVEGRYVETRPIDGVFETFDILPVLQRRYHTKAIVLDIPNPVVPRVVLPVLRAPGPQRTEVAAEPRVPPEAFKAMRDRLAREAAAAHAQTNGHQEK